MKRLLILLMLAPSVALALQGPNAHFDTDQAEVINAATIKAFISNLPASTGVRIYCHTDIRASVAHNEQLARRRCDSVSKLFNSHSVPVSAYVVVGETKPSVSSNVTSTTDKHGRHGINRRVEIHYDVAPVRVTELNRHNVRLYVGYAPSGIDPPKLIAPSHYKVDEDWDVEFGLGYSYRIWEGFGLGVSAFTNKSDFGTIEYNF